MSFLLRLPRKCIFADPLQMSHACHHSWKCYKTLTFWSLLTRCTIPTRNDIWTSKNGPYMVCCFAHFDLEMCFAPQRRALFRHRNFQKWSEPLLTWKCASRHNGVHFFDISFSKSAPSTRFCTFWLANVLRATTACNFSSLIWPAGSAPAALASLRFDLPETQTIGKTQCFATFLPFHASASSFFLRFFLLIFLFSLPLPCSAFHLCILSEVWLLNFLRLVTHSYIHMYAHDYYICNCTDILVSGAACMSHTRSFRRVFHVTLGLMQADWSPNGQSGFGYQANWEPEMPEAFKVLSGRWPRWHSHNGLRTSNFLDPNRQAQGPFWWEKAVSDFFRTPDFETYFRYSGKYQDFIIPWATFIQNVSARIW